MITSTIYLKNDVIRPQFKLLAILSLILLGALLWNAHSIQKEVKAAKATIHKHKGLENQLIQLEKLTADSIFNHAQDTSKIGVFQSWIDIAYWLEDNRKISSKLNTEYSYEIDTLIVHPQSSNNTFEVNVEYNFKHPTQKFPDLIKQVYQNLDDSTKNIFIKELAVVADSNGIKHSRSTLGAWLQP